MVTQSKPDHGVTRTSEILYLCKNCNIKLTDNVNTNGKLTNGMPGTLL